MEAADVEAADVEAADVEAADVEAARGNAQRDICFGRLWACILPAYIHVNIHIICGVHCQCPLVPLAVHFVWGPKKCPLHSNYYTADLYNNRAAGVGLLSLFDY